MTRRTGSRMVSSVPPRALAMMALVSDLELFEHRLPAGVSLYEWQPYARDAGFTYEWWHRLWNLGHRYSLWSVVDGDVEVARIELDQEVHYDHYTGVPHLGPKVSRSTSSRSPPRCDARASVGRRSSSSLNATRVDVWSRSARKRTRSGLAWAGPGTTIPTGSRRTGPSSSHLKVGLRTE
jgi:hypothetical protein